jgi:hypothetical protein
VSNSPISLLTTASEKTDTLNDLMGNSLKLTHPGAPFFFHHEQFQVVSFYAQSQSIPRFTPIDPLTHWDWPKAGHIFIETRAVHAVLFFFSSSRDLRPPELRLMRRKNQSLC